MRVAHRRIGERLELGELAAPPLAHRIGQRTLEVAEEEEGCLGPPLLAHEEQRHLRAEQQHGLQRLDGLGPRQHGEPLAHRPVADLVVVLDEVDEGLRPQMPARLPAPGTLTVRGRLALVDEAGAEAPEQEADRVVGIIGVVAVGLSRSR